jgi:acyl-coenzyme A thioesterase PaaI-like protein
LHLIAFAGNDTDLSAKFTVTENHQGAPGHAHGGLLSFTFAEALGKLMWLIRNPGVTGRLETDFLLPVPMGHTLYINARITGQSGRKIYTQAVGRLGSPLGEIAFKASSLFIAVPIEHFSRNLTEQHKDHLVEHPELMAFVDSDFDINP